MSKNPNTASTKPPLTIPVTTGLGGSLRAPSASRASKSQPQISSSIPSTGILNYASPSTMFSTSPGFGSIPSPSLTSRGPKSDNHLDIDGDSTWKDLSSKVLPLFNGEGLHATIEDLNELIVVSIVSIPFPELLNKMSDLLQQGIVTLNNKLSGVPDEKLGSRMMEIWSFFFGTVLPYLQGVFLPLQIELGTEQDFSVRKVLLIAFRDNLVLPHMDRMADSLQKTVVDSEESRRSPDTIPRMLQMLTILSEIADTKNAIIVSALNKLKTDVKKYGRDAHSARSEEKLNV